MKTKISYFAMGLLLLAFTGTQSVGAQSGDPLGPSCNYRQIRILTLPGIEQKFGTSWCWAATAQNVMDFHDKKMDPPPKTIDQCALVAKVYSEEYLEHELCCGDISTACWGESGHPEWVFDQFQFSFEPPYEYGKNLTWTQATEEICQNRPFISSLDLATGDRHSVVITGYEVTRGVRVYDPALNGIIYESSANFFDGESPNYTRFRDTYNIKPKR